MFPTTLEHPYVSRGRRRGRNDPNSRDYICPCGKSYLSYPALFTHIKIKHNGRAPGQIIKPRSQNASRRGRPRAKQVYDSESDTQDIAANCIDRLCDFVTDIQKWEDNGKLKQLYMKDDFYNIYLNYNPQEQEPRYNQGEQLYQQTCDNVFCQVLAEVNKRLNEPYYVDVLMMFFVMLARCINQNLQTQKIQYGMIDQNQEEEEEYQQKSQKQKYDEDQEQLINDEPYEENENEEQLDNQDGQNQIDNEEQEDQQQNAQKERILLQNQKLSLLRVKNQSILKIVNYINGFINSSFPKYVKQYQFQNVPLFNSKNIKRLIQHFFHWLTMRKYLCYKLKINPNYSESKSLKQIQNKA